MKANWITGKGTWLAILSLFIFGVPCGSAENAVEAPPLGPAAKYLVLAGKAFLNKGDSLVRGNAGVSPGRTVQGMKNSVVEGRLEAGMPEPYTAQEALMTAYYDLERRPCGTNLTGQNLAGAVLKPGVYCSDSDLLLSGVLTLDGTGDTRAVFIFQVKGNLATAAMTRFELRNAANACNVYWNVGDSARIGSGSSFAGNVLALNSIAMGYNARLNGRLLARRGKVALDKNEISACPVPAYNMEGRMAGRGSRFEDNRWVDHEFQFTCYGGDPAGLRVAVNEKKVFELTRISTVACLEDPSILPNPPVLGFDTLRGSGIGTYNGRKNYSVTWTFTDGEDPARADFVDIVIRDPRKKIVFWTAGRLQEGDHQSYSGRSTPSLLQSFDDRPAPESGLQALSSGK